MAASSSFGLNEEAAFPAAQQFTGLAEVVTVLTFRQAVGGVWAGNLVGWLGLFVPASLLVVLQESATDFPGWPVLVALAVAEHLAAGAVIATVVLLARRRWTIIPLTVLFPMWVIAGAARGLVWAVLASTIGNDSALVQYRIATWVGISVLWIPLFTYAMAQLDHRRLMLSRLSAARLDLAVDRARAEVSARARRAELMATVHRTISPVIREIHRSLNTISAGIDRTALISMSERLGVVAFDAARLVAAEGPEERPARAQVERAPIAASLDFPQQRPFLTAGLAGLALLPAIIPDVWRIHGPEMALNALLSLGVLIVVLTAILFALQRLRERRGKPPEWIFVVAFLVPGATASAALIAFLGGDLSGSLTTLVIALPLGALFAGACLSAAFGLAGSNQSLADVVEVATDEAAGYRRRADSAEKRAREQVAELLHGPVYGRLSACVMALNFYASALASSGTPQPDDITHTVLEYLEAASRDLDALAST